MTRLNSNPGHVQCLQLIHCELQLVLGMLPLTVCNKTLSTCLKDDPEIVFVMANLDYKKEKFASTIEKYKIAKQIMGDLPMFMF